MSYRQIYVRIIINTLVYTWIFLATYFVQDFNITKNWDNGSLTIKFYFLNEPNCHFINATGISVVFKTPIQLKKSFNITSDNDAQLVTLSKSGNYSVSVYDIVNGSLLGPVFEFYGIQVDLDISTTEHISSTCMSFQNETSKL